jgi:flagellar protein FliO/FliZ
MILATIFVVALLYFMLKFINKKSKTYKSSQLVENLGGTALGNNRSVQLIKVGSRILVVGVGENIQLLKEIDNPEELNLLISDYNEKMQQLLQPSDIVTKVLQRRKNAGQQDERNGSQFHSLLSQQLEDITKGRKQLYKEMEKKGSDEQ